MAQQCVELELQNCLDEIERMQSKISDLEYQLQLQRIKDDAPPQEADDSGELGEVAIDGGNLAGYEKVVASRRNATGTTTQMFALKKTIPGPSKSLPCGPTQPPVAQPPRSSCGSPCGAVQPAGAGQDPPNNKVIYMKHTHETAVYRPHQSPCPGAGPGCTCPGGPIHSDDCKDRPPARSPCGDKALTCPRIGAQPLQRRGAQSLPCGAPCGAPVLKQPVGSQGGPPQPKPPCAGASPCGQNAPCGSPKAGPSGIQRIQGKVTAAEKNENPFVILGAMIECAESEPQPVCPEEPPSADAPPKTEEEEKLEDVVNFINQEIFPILIEAVKGIIERVDNSDACFCLAQAMENENSFNEAIKKYRAVSKGINCFMQDILKSLSTKLAERSEKYSPQVGLLLAGKGVVEQAEIALSEEIGRAIGREESVSCPQN